MNKLDDLKGWLERTVPGLDKDPERLFLQIEKGTVVPRNGTLSFEYRFTVSVTLLEMPIADLDGLSVALIFWIQRQQPEQLVAPNASKGIPFTPDYLDRLICDLRFELELTELVSVLPRQAGGYDILHRAEPDLEPGFSHLDGFKTDTGLLRLFVNGEQILGPPAP